MNDCTKKNSENIALVSYRFQTTHNLDFHNLNIEQKQNKRLHQI